ncbi:MAG TPA: response regulator [Microscillaceae bacterium]|nr:response regulator [Microscillaceae bacterium]
MSKVLIVDDEPNILLSLEFLMKKQGYKVYIARDGAEAMDMIKEQEPEVVVLDIMMPEVDGYEVCSFIKNDDGLKHIKVIFLTAKTKPEDIEKGKEIGADAYMTKPFSTRNLMKKVKEILVA